jgi:hypothetical protein
MPKAKAKTQPPAVERRPWSKDDIRTLKQMSHESAPEIAKKLGRTVGAIYQQAAKRSVHLGTVKRRARKTAPKAAKSKR